MKTVKKEKSMFVRDKVRGGMNRWSIRILKAVKILCMIP